MTQEKINKTNYGLEYLKKIMLPTEEKAIETLLIGVKDLDARMVIFNRLTEKKEVAKRNISEYFQTIVNEGSLSAQYSLNFFKKNHEILELELMGPLVEAWRHLKTISLVNDLAEIIVNAKGSQVLKAKLQAQIYHLEKERSNTEQNKE